MNNKLSFEEIRAVVPDELLDFETTREIDTLEQIIGQERAVNALKFGLHVDKTGFIKVIDITPVVRRIFFDS